MVAHGASRGSAVFTGISPGGATQNALLLSGSFCRPYGACTRLPALPTTCVVGYPLAPLRGLFRWLNGAFGGRPSERERLPTELGFVLGLRAKKKCRANRDSRLKPC